MHLTSNILTLSQLLLLWTLNIPSSHTHLSSNNPFHPTPQLPFQVPPQRSQSNGGRSWYSRARNALIHTIWRVPPADAQSGIKSGDSTTASPPPTLLAQYGEDLVLRFEIKSSKEAEALVEAVNVLFLDVWEFTSEWVDIRLSKDIVSMQLYVNLALY